MNNGDPTFQRYDLEFLAFDLLFKIFLVCFSLCSGFLFCNDFLYSICGVVSLKCAKPRCIFCFLAPFISKFIGMSFDFFIFGTE